MSLKIYVFIKMERLYLKYVVMKNLQLLMKICRNTCLFFFASVIMNAGDFMKKIVIKENKIPLIVGIIDTLFFWILFDFFNDRWNYKS